MTSMSVFILILRSRSIHPDQVRQGLSRRGPHPRPRTGAGTSPPPKKDANRAHAELRTPDEHANARIPGQDVRVEVTPRTSTTSPSSGTSSSRSRLSFMAGLWQTPLTDALATRAVLSICFRSFESSETRRLGGAKQRANGNRLWTTPRDFSRSYLQLNAS
jgi:hypothetical protein